MPLRSPFVIVRRQRRIGLLLDIIKMYVWTIIKKTRDNISSRGFDDLRERTENAPSTPLLLGRSAWC